MASVDNCWLWAGSKTPEGYGHLYVKGVGKPYAPQQAHRVIYEALVGEIPKGMYLDHLCRVPACINPEHLEPVSPRVNVLRGIGPTALNAKKTHCPYGHPYAEFAQPLRHQGGGIYRRCGKCHAQKELIRRRRIKLSQA